MQSVHSRIRRTVEKENRDIDIDIGRKIDGCNSNKSKKKRRRPKQRFNFFLLLLVLLPIAIIGVCIYFLIGPGASPNKSKRLRNGRTVVTVEGDADSDSDAAKKIKIHTDEKRIVANAERGRKMHEILEKRTTENKNKSKSKNNNNNNNSHKKFKFLVLTTIHGNIKITLRPDLSKGSVNYIYQLVESYGGHGKKCAHCRFYRSEKPGILQGIMEHKGVVPVNTVKGSCPTQGGAEKVRNNCPAWDKQCGCHGPVMTRGAVAWAAGQAGGPDFFINGYPAPSTMWGTQHTNFGFVDDHASLDILDAIWELPVVATPGMHLLEDPIHFDLVLLY